MNWKGLTAGLLLLAAVLAGLLVYQRLQESAPRYGTALADTPTSAPLITGPRLLRDDGQRVLLGGPSAQIKLIYLGYTRCGVECPLALGMLAHAYRALDAQQRSQVQVIMLSVDPQYDTPARLRAYLRRFDADFHGLTGTPAQVQQATSALMIMNTRDAQGHILHGDEVAVLNRQGQYERVYSGLSLATTQLAQDLPRLLP